MSTYLADLQQLCGFYVYILWYLHSVVLMLYVAYIDVTQFAKTGHNSAFIEIHFIASSYFGH